MRGEKREGKERGSGAGRRRSHSVCVIYGAEIGRGKERLTHWMHGADLVRTFKKWRMTSVKHRFMPRAILQNDPDTNSEKISGIPTPEISSSIVATIFSITP